MDAHVASAKEYLALGRRSEKNGLTFLASLRYTQASTILIMRMALHLNGSHLLSPEDQAAWALLQQDLSMRFRMLLPKLGNGKRPSVSGGANDTMGMALEVILQELESF